MTTIDLAALEQALNLLPDQHRGPAGVAGVVKDGQIIARRAWGYADMYRALPMTAQTRLPICSIAKQLTCALLLDLFDDPAKLDPLLPALLPRFQGPLPTVAQLCHNQSGLRDYWALTVLHGAKPEGLFTEADGLRLMGQTQSGHFAPGAHYSYSNGNFRLFAELIRNASGRDFVTPELVDQRLIFPILSLHSVHNGLVDYSTRMHMQNFMANGTRRSEALPHHGHQDALIGTGARATFARIAAFLE